MSSNFWGFEYYKDYERISKQNVENLILNDAEANAYWKKANKNLTIGWIAVGVQAGFLIWQLDRAGNNQDQILPLMGVLGSGAVAVGFTLSSNKQRKNAILTYNKNQAMGSIHFGPTYNGLGMLVRF